MDQEEDTPRTEGPDEADDAIDLELTEEQVTELREAFAIYDPDDSGLIHCEHFGSALRAFGQTPTEAELQELLETVEKDEQECMTFQTYMKAVAQLGLPDKEQNEDQLRDAFRVFDPDNTGIVRVSKLKQILTTLGETVTTEDVNEMLEEATVDKGRLYYEDLLRALTTK